VAGFCKVACCLYLLAILLCAGCSGNDADQPLRPNILLILADDLGNNDIATWGDGKAPTPTMDLLSSQSIRFRQNYTDATCSPSRAALLTGREPVSIGFQSTALGLSPDLQTLPEQLRSLGYRTSHIGKWHVGEALEYASIQPSEHGFDYWFGMLNHFVLQGPDASGQLVRRRPTHWNPWLQENGAPAEQFKGYLDDILTDKAIEKLQSKNGQPWFVNLWLYSPHAPYQPPPEDAARFPNTPEGKYLAALARLDHNLARLLKALEASGQAENTIVVFASDNGGTNKARDNNWPFSGVKTTYLEGGQRSPLMLHWPGHYESRDITSPSNIMDVFPTLISLAGGQPPQDIDGRTLVGTMRGEPREPAEPLFYASTDIIHGMSYGGRFFAEGRLFYRPFVGELMTAAIPPALDYSAPKASRSVAKAEASALIRNWERSVRVVPLAWRPAKGRRPGLLTGRNLQRAPVFGEFSMGLVLRGEPFADSVQTLIEQEGVWQVQLLADRRLRILHGAVEQFSTPLEQVESCNTLVISSYVSEEIKWPFTVSAATSLQVYWNGKSVLDSTHLLRRPDREEVLTHPTLIGARADGSEAFMGTIDQPLVINKRLYAGQEGYGLEDLQQRLCSSPSGKAH
jgi:arylsulfatase A-like enzyme